LILCILREKPLVHALQFWIQVLLPGSVFIHADYELTQEDADPEFLADKINTFLKKLIFCSNEVKYKKMSLFLMEHKDELIAGNYEYSKEKKE